LKPIERVVKQKMYEGKGICLNPTLDFHEKNPMGGGRTVRCKEVARAKKVPNENISQRRDQENHIAVWVENGSFAAEKVQKNPEAM